VAAAILWISALTSKCIMISVVVICDKIKIFWDYQEIMIEISSMDLDALNLAQRALEFCKSSCFDLFRSTLPVGHHSSK